MKKNIIVAIISIIVVIGAIFTAMMSEKKVSPKQEEKIIFSEKITDECTEEYEMKVQEGQLAQVSSADEKVSANSAMILKKYYKECSHTINEYLEILPELVNLTQEEIIKEFPEWELIGFTPNEIILYQEIEGKCGEHFTLREEQRKNSHI